MLGMVGRKIRKAYRGRQTPHGKQSVRKLMAHGTSTNSIELSGDAKSFDRVARKWNVDYAFYKTGPDKYLLFFKAGQADAMTACFSEYSRKVLSKAKSNRVPIREQLQQAADQLSKDCSAFIVICLFGRFNSRSAGIFFLSYPSLNPAGRKNSREAS